MAAAFSQGPSLEPKFDPQTGCWTGLLWDGKELLPAIRSDIELSLEGSELPPVTARKLVDSSQEGNVWHVVQQAGDWRLEWTFAASGPQLRRHLKLTYNGSEPVKLWNAFFIVPGARLSESPNDFYLIPGNYPPQRRQFDTLREGYDAREQGWTRGDYALAFVHSPSAKLSLSVGYAFTHDEAHLHVFEGNDSVSPAHQFNAITVVEPGRTLELGDQVIRVTEGDEQAGLAGLDALVETLELGPPEDSPASVHEGGLYEFHPWGRLEMWHQGDRGMRYPRLTKLMPYYQALGMKTLWVLPASWPPPWVYTLPEFDRVAPENGSPEELKAMVDAAHAHGMRQLIDLVVYGIHPDSSEVAKLPPEVWCRDEAGNPVLVWGNSVQAADCSNPLWQQRIAEVVAHWRDEFGFDGTRLDCIGWGQTVNWANPDRASDAVAYGGLQLNKVVRDTFRESNPDAVTLPEGGKPLVFTNSDLLFDYPLYLAMRDLTGQPDLAKWVSDTQEWLQLEGIGYPNRGLNGLVRFLQNHDVVEPSDFFGVGLSQALQALITFLPGVPLVYQEQEQGFVADLSAWMALRNSEECFRTGAADFHAGECSDPRVFTFLREAADGAAVVAINLTGEPASVTLKWPEDVASRFPTVVDGFSRAKATGTVTLAPWRPAVLLLKPAGWVDSWKAEASPEAEKTGAELRFTPEGYPEIDGATEWFVQTAEGLLRGDFNALGSKARADGNVLSAMPVLERAWFPLDRGRLDGAALASFGVKTSRGTVAVEFDPRQVTKAHIADLEVDGQGVQLVVEPASAMTVRQLGPGEEYIPVWKPVEVEGLALGPQFVTLQADGLRLAAARRQGGGLAGLWIGDEGDNLVLEPGMTYTDWGLYEDKTLSATRWANNPRLYVGEGDQPGFAFVAPLYQSPWNGVAPAPLRQPVVLATQGYQAVPKGLALHVGITPTVDLPARKAFFAMSFSLKGFEGWRGETGTGKRGELVGQRLGQHSAWLELDLAGHTLRLDNLNQFQNCFLIDSGDGRVRLFLALLEGDQVDLPKSEEYSATALLTVVK